MAGTYQHRNLLSWNWLRYGPGFCDVFTELCHGTSTDTRLCHISLLLWSDSYAEECEIRCFLSNMCLTSVYLQIVKNITLHESKYKCQVMAPFMDVSQTSMYKSKHNLTYPVNVGRNVAREASVTHFLLPSDIELYPNPGLVTQFLKMYSKMKDDVVKE